MRKIILFSIFSVFVANVFAQGEVIWKKIDGSEMPDTLTLEMETGHTEIVLEALISNVSSEAKDVLLKRTIVSYVSGATDQLCYGTSCQMGGENNVEIVTGASELAANTDASTIVPFDMIHYKPNGNEGVTVLKYYILTENGSNVTVQDSVVVKFSFTDFSGIVNASENLSFNVFPNPFENSLTVDNLDNVKSLVISNILGKPVYETHNLLNSLSINTDEFIDGIYFVTVITNNNKVYTKRIVKK